MHGGIIEIVYIIPIKSNLLGISTQWKLFSTYSQILKEISSDL